MFLPRTKDELPLSPLLLFPPILFSPSPPLFYPSSAFPSSPLSLLYFLSFPVPPLPLEEGPLNTAMGFGERCKLPQWGIWAEAPADKRFGAHWSQKVQLLWQQFFFDFPKNKCNFLHETSLISYGGSNSSQSGVL